MFAVRCFKKIVPRFIFLFFRYCFYEIMFLKTKRNVKSLTKPPLNIELGGCTDRVGWLTCDIRYELKPNLVWDITRGLPFADQSINQIYTSHMLEHFTFEQIEACLQDCYRVLKPNGFIKICVPNAKLFIAAYTKKIKNSLKPRRILFIFQIQILISISSIILPI